MTSVNENQRLPRSAARQARMGYMVTKALSTKSAIYRVVPDAETNKLGITGEFVPSDFIVQYLGLRVRLVLLIDAKSATDLTDPVYLENARIILAHWPETSAVGLIANDDALTTVIVEPPEVTRATGVPSGTEIAPRPAERGLPIVQAVARYLEHCLPSWSDIPEITLDSGDGSPVDLALEASERAVAKEKAKRAQIPQRLVARKSLGAHDVAWAIRLVEAVMSGNLDTTSAAEAIEDQAGLSS